MMIIRMILAMLMLMHDVVHAILATGHQSRCWFYGIQLMYSPNYWVQRLNNSRSKEILCNFQLLVVDVVWPQEIVHYSYNDMPV